MDLWLLVAVTGLLILSAFFAVCESAYASVKGSRVKKTGESASSSDKMIASMLSNHERTVTTASLGAMIVNLSLAAFLTVVSVSRWGSVGVWYGALISLALVLLFGVMIPRTIGEDHALRVVRLTALPLRAMTFLLFPAVAVFSRLSGAAERRWESDSPSLPSVTEDELYSIIETVEDEGVIDEEQSELLQSAIEFSDITAQEILTPRVDMLAVDVDDDIDTILSEVMDSPYSRIPVYEDTVDNIIGVLSLNHLYKKVVETRDFDLREIMMKPLFIPKTMRLPAVLAQLRHRQSHLAVVTDEYGGTMGILTMEDALEQLVGDIWDESDVVVDDFVRIDDDHFEVSGDLSIYDFLEEMQIDEDHLDGGYTTVGGWAIEYLQGYPHRGDSFRFLNLLVTVKEVEDLRILRLEVAVLSPEAEDDE